ncbi:MAG: phosphate ABC transporter substrate-binding protein PstS [Chloroflexota bacterium]
MNLASIRLPRRAAAGLLGLSALLMACSPAAAPAPTAAPKTDAKPAATAAVAAPAAPAAATAAPKPTDAPKPATDAPKPTEAAKPMGLGLITGPFEGEAKALNGAGATFPAALYSKWFEEYFKLTGVKVNYQSIGSGGGIKSIQDQTVDFGATDGPMNDEQLKGAKGGNVFHVPTALGAVVPTYNIPGVTEQLKFTPDTLAGIFLGDITKWNDPKLVADNPSLANVNKEIVTVHRSDGSGTTFIFVDYLSTVSPSWAQKVGRGTSVNWPNGLGGKGNEGVAGEVKQNPNSIGYVELIYAIQNKLGVGLVKNKAGKFTEPKLESVSAAAAGVAQSIAPDLRASIVDAPGETAYPISGFTWLLIYEKQDDAAKATALTRMAWWAIYDAQKFNGDLGYAPVPTEITAKGAEMLKKITAQGKAVFPGR